MDEVKVKEVNVDLINTKMEIEHFKRKYAEASGKADAYAGLICEFFKIMLNRIGQNNGDE